MFSRKLLMATIRCFNGLKIGYGSSRFFSSTAVFIFIEMVVLYIFAQQAAAVAESWKDDPLPAFKLLEPDRNVSARDWKSPYCMAWDDGCTRCTKPSAKSKPICNDIAAEQRCVPEKIKCDSGDWKELRRLCAGPAYIKVDEYGNILDITYCDFDFEVDKKTGFLKSREQGVCMSVAPSNWRKVLDENIVIRNLPVKDNYSQNRKVKAPWQTLICTYPQFFDRGWIIIQSR